MCLWLLHLPDGLALYHCKMSMFIFTDIFVLKPMLSDIREPLRLPSGRCCLSRLFHPFYFQPVYIRQSKERLLQATAEWVSSFPLQCGSVFRSDRRPRPPPAFVLSVSCLSSLASHVTAFLCIERVLSAVTFRFL